MTTKYNYTIDENIFYSTKEAANLFNVGVWTILKLRQDGLLKGMRVGRSYKFLGKHIISMINHEFKKETKC